MNILCLESRESIDLGIIKLNFSRKAGEVEGNSALKTMNWMTSAKKRSRKSQEEYQRLHAINKVRKSALACQAASISNYSCSSRPANAIIIATHESREVVSQIVQGVNENSEMSYDG